MREGTATPATRVALVEDDNATRERLAASVRAQSSLELAAAYRNGAEALAGLASRAPDVLLVDLGLPDMSGLELIRFAAERYPECDILVISIFGDEANVLAALEAGARGYLLKGSLQHDIAFDIRDLRNGGSPLSPVIARQMRYATRVTTFFMFGAAALLGALLAAAFWFRERSDTTLLWFALTAFAWALAAFPWLHGAYTPREFFHGPLAFALRFVDGMDLNEVASACGVSRATVSRRLERAERRFAEGARRHEALAQWLERSSRWSP